MRTSVFFPLAIALAAIIRVFASLGQPIARFPDTIGYEFFRLFGPVNRIGPIPILYSLIHSDPARVATQILLGVAAWTWVALLMARTSQYPRIVLTFILLLGVSPQVVRYDLTILSESLGITFMVFAVASTINVQRQRSPLTVSIWLVSIFSCALTRPVHLWILAVVLAAPFIALVASRGKRANLSTAFLVFILLVGVLQVRANSSTSTLNFYTVLQDRVLRNDERFLWFQQHGMPTSVGMRDALGYDFAEQLPSDVAAIVDLPTGQQPPSLMRIGGVELARWVTEHGWKTYARFIGTHPQDSLSRITSLTNATLSPPNDDFLPLDNGPMIPRVLFGAWELWSLIGIGSLVVVFFKKPKEFTMLLAFAISGLGVYTISMLSSGIEHPRHAVTSAAALRLIACVSAVLALPCARQKANIDGSVVEPS